MKPDRLRELTINVSLVLAALALLGILGASGLLLEAARNSFFEDMRVRAGIMARRAGAAMFPREDLFSLHLLVNTQMLDRAVRSAAVYDLSGRARSHSDPDKIGVPAAGREIAAARGSRVALTQTAKLRDGLDCFYFSEPIVVGRRRVGTAVVTADSATLREKTEPVRRKLLLIFLGALGALALLLEMRGLLRRERAAAALKSAMVHTVSHEFNNALTVIDAAVFMLKETEPAGGDASRADLYGAIDYERDSLRRFVKNILNEARMESGRFRIEKRPLALRELARASLKAVDGLLRRKRISVSLEMPKDPVMVAADREAMALVVSNLVGNALKYTPEGGAIKVSLAGSAREGRVSFRIENTGPGIAPADLARLREEFFRTGEARAAAEGFGLGLKVCSDMLRLHGSSLEAESEPGRFTRFTFSLPRAA